MGLFTILLILYFALHSLLASTKVKQYLKQRIIPLRYYRLMYNVFALVALIPVYFSYQSLDKSLIFHSNILKWIGGLLLVVGLMTLWKALKGYDLSAFAGTYQYRAKKEEAAGQLITSGLNAHVRHPLYFAALLLIWGGFLFATHLPMLLFASITTSYLWLGTKLEEQKLLLQFGEAYADYQQRVPMLIPLRWNKMN